MTSRVIYTLIANLMNYTIMELHGMKISMKLQQKDWLVKLYIPGSIAYYIDLFIMFTQK